MHIIQLKLINAVIELPEVMACGVCLSFQNKIRFTNGRHRTVNAENFAAPFIPLQSMSGGIDVFKETFEFR